MQRVRVVALHIERASLSGGNIDTCSLAASERRSHGVPCAEFAWAEGATRHTRRLARRAVCTRARDQPQSAQPTRVGLRSRKAPCSGSRRGDDQAGLRGVSHRIRFCSPPGVRNPLTPWRPETPSPSATTRCCRRPRRGRGRSREGSQLVRRDI